MEQGGDQFRDGGDNPLYSEREEYDEALHRASPKHRRGRDDGELTPGPRLRDGESEGDSESLQTDLENCWYVLASRGHA